MPPVDERPQVALSALTRRDFFKVGGAGVAVAAFPGCKPGSNPSWLGDGERVPSGPESEGRVTCSFCASLCGARVRVVGEHAVSVRGRQDHPKNAGALCPRGIAGVQALYDLDRLVQPVGRVDRAAAFGRLSWDEAIKRVGERLAALDPTKTPAVVIDSLTGLESELARRFAGALRAGYLRDDGMEQLGAVWGGPLAWDYSRSRYAIFFGCEFLEDGPDLMDALRALGLLKHAGAKIVVVGSRYGISAAKADEFVPIEPGSEAALALAMAGKLDREKAAKATGVSEAVIERLTGEFAAQGPQVAIGWRLDRRALEAVHWLNSSAGSLGKPGGLVRSEPPPLAPWEAGAQPMPVPLESAKVVILAGGDPVHRWRSRNRLMRVLERAELVVAISPTLTDTAARADLVFPSTTWLEQEAVHRPQVAGKQVVAYSAAPASLRRPTEAKPAGQVIIELSHRLPAARRRHMRFESYSAAIRERLLGLHDAQRGTIKADTFGEFLAKLEEVGLWMDEAPAVEPKALDAAPELRSVSGEGLMLVPFATATLGRGEGASLPWMQELSGAGHHLGWQTWIELNPKHGFQSGDTVRVRGPKGEIRLRVVATEAVHPRAAYVPLGGGHTESGRWAKGRGANVNDLLAAEGPTFVKVERA